MVVLRLSIFAQHVGDILMTEAPARFTLAPCDGVRVEVEITKNGSEWPAVWDGVAINNEYCGNRRGGVEKLLALVFDAKPEVILD